MNLTVDPRVSEINRRVDLELNRCDPCSISVFELGLHWVYNSIDNLQNDDKCLANRGTNFTADVTLFAAVGTT
jgi:hypothetical protein